MVTARRRPHRQRPRPHRCRGRQCPAWLSGQQVVVIDRVVAERDLRVVIRMGMPRPMHATADGKALLSTLTDDHVREWLGNQSG
ncbi:IclR family transcriptional regulator domain-containing protein [Pseudomonas sp.]|uniref:IclR family transcriptional regulator domain-containing protein n=1 Tax=Pseudomonas sp. TaxID=306 RepID=UPI003BEECFF3